MVTLDLTLSLIFKKPYLFIAGMEIAGNFTFRVIFLFWVAKIISKSCSQFNKIHLRNFSGNARISCTISRCCLTVTSNLTCS
ncbi:hypothetical protein TSAR_011266 [Trichomalopsis sarcophagae]|uniref:Uncharacterized protein n=1 Tax=Trichomalopsis sarcophagae TaxID=543379 RepID=A0A232FBJ8_9HYME|nr:hypothetical protein TSAR_011266 [Trichomalopsis sarcophagae]